MLGICKQKYTIQKNGLKAQNTTYSTCVDFFEHIATCNDKLQELDISFNEVNNANKDMA